MDLVTTRQDDVLLVTVEGASHLDAETSTLFREKLLDLVENQKAVVVDLGGVTFLDSSGLGALVSAFKRMSQWEGEIKLARITPEVRSLFEVLRLHRVFEMYETLEEAVASFRPSEE